jgi:hypothetical protein
VPIDEQESYSDDELARLDLRELLGGGIRGDDGRMRGELQGEGSVAAAVQLESAGVRVEDLTGALTSLRAGGDAPQGPPALAELVRTGLAACADDEERALFLRWLGNVTTLMLMRSRARP